MGEDNFWASGATGPCGPCSEIYFDFHPERGDQHIDLEDDSRFLEIYNLVFMELNRLSDGSLVPLAKQNIDTGMGLERLAQVLQGVPNNYETDLIMPIIDAVSAIAPVPYRQCAPFLQTSFKVIADHIRAVVHMIADGITPSNVGRGYILRRLIRRVVRHGKLVGIVEQFLTHIAETAIQLNEAAYPQVRQQETLIKEELAREEDRFRQTLERGERLLIEVLAKPETQQSKQISGSDAFVLYDTYGFPLELTQEIAQEHNCSVDRAGFDQAMAQQQERSKLARTDIDLLAQNVWSDLAKEIGTTEFVGYTQLSGAGIVKALLVDQRRVNMAEAGQKVLVILDQTPFYAEGGGQVADQGVLSNGSLLIQVTDVQKEADLYIHFGWIESGVIQVNDIVNTKVRVSQRRRTQVHHSSTHLLQAALQKIVDSKITQAGSLVTAERLRFDFHLPRPVTAEELAQVEQQVNTWIAEAHQAYVSIMPLEQAKAKGAIAMFGEKYSDLVRVIDFPTVSMELCGGTHVHNTSEIGLFKIVAETGVASGIRRIEAVAGQAVLDYLAVRDALTRELSDRFKARPEEILDRVTALQNELKNTQKQLETLQRQIALQQADQLLLQSETIGQWRILVAELPNTDPEALKTAGEKLISKLGINSAVVLGTVPSAAKSV
jgi:alanyl-tRNA synthetase (EC 6.1.1.7)